MSALQNAIRSSSSRLIQNRQSCQGLRSLLSGSPAQFLTETAPPTNRSSFTRPLFESPFTGLLYRKLFGITKSTLKSDILSLFEECNLNTGDLKVEYNPSYAPTGMMVQFSSLNAYDAACRAVARKGSLYRLERADRAGWDYI